MSTSDLANPPELVFGLVRAIGTDLGEVTTQIAATLRNAGFPPGERKSDKVDIRLSDLFADIEFLEGALKDPRSSERTPEQSRYHTHMNAGDFLRGLTKRADAVALLGIREIRRLRSRAGATVRGRAFVLRSLMRPEEVDTLRKVYGSQFFVISVFSPTDERERALAKKLSVPGGDPEEVMRAAAIDLVNRDVGILQSTQEAARAVLPKYRLDVRKTFEHGDLFVSVTDPDASRSAIRRFIELIFGHPFETPTRDEYGMGLAYATSIQSASLSRRVGACLLNSDGEVLSTGTNEVPKSGGGLYWTGDTPDGRDFCLREDVSDRIRRELVHDVVLRLFEDQAWMQKLGAPPLDAPKIRSVIEAALLSKALWDARALEVVEYSRAVHAEMVAITGAARRGVPTSGATLYCTTFPCHECARHIVAAGIKQVVYIEAYPKSRVASLYSDSIGLADRREDVGGRVRFVPFIGIAPRRFSEVFSWVPRKQTDVDPKEPWLSGRTAEWSLPSADLRASILDPEAHESGARGSSIEHLETHMIRAFEKRLNQVKDDKQDLKQQARGT